MYKRGDAFQTKTKRFFAKYNIFFLEKGKEKVVVVGSSPWWGSLDGQHASSRVGARSTGERNPSRGWEEDLVGGLQIAMVVEVQPCSLTLNQSVLYMPQS